MSVWLPRPEPNGAICGWVSFLFAHRQRMYSSYSEKLFFISSDHDVLVPLFVIACCYSIYTICVYTFVHWKPDPDYNWFKAVVFACCSPLIGSKLGLFFILFILQGSPFLRLQVYWIRMQGTFRAVNGCGNKENCLHAMALALPPISSFLRVVLYSLILVKFKRSMLPGKKLLNAVKQRDKKKRNVFRIAVAILKASALCWGPKIIALLTVLRKILNFWNVHPKVFAMKEEFSPNSMREKRSTFS